MKFLILKINDLDMYFENFVGECLKIHEIFLRKSHIN
jgi:hypothetical protein